MASKSRTAAVYGSDSGIVMPFLSSLQNETFAKLVFSGAGADFMSDLISQPFENIRFKKCKPKGRYQICLCENGFCKGFRLLQDMAYEFGGFCVFAEQAGYLKGGFWRCHS